jgi:hypothetical protein
MFSNTFRIGSEHLVKVKASHYRPGVILRFTGG